jgi:hypothetical protein
MSMSLADACLVRMTEIDRKSLVLTLDGDFGIYRRNRRQVVPTISPDKRPSRTLGRSPARRAPTAHDQY